MTKIYFMIKVYTHFTVNKPQNLYHLLLITLYYALHVIPHILAYINTFTLIPTENLPSAVQQKEIKKYAREYV